MKYYKMSQCGDNNNVMLIPNISSSELKNSNGIVRQIKESENSVFLSFYKKPFPIVSDKLKKTIAVFNPEVISLPLALANMNTKFETLYWILSLETIPHKMEKTKVVLNTQDIENRTIFKIKLGIMEYVIVSFDLAEAILRDLNVDTEFEEVMTNE